MSSTATKAEADLLAEMAEVRQLTIVAVANSRRDHQQWHWNTKQTDCPWGCGDGSGIITR